MNTLIVLRWILYARAGGHVRFTPAMAHACLDGVSLYASRKAFRELRTIGFLTMRNNNHYVINRHSVMFANMVGAAESIEEYGS